MRFAVPLALLFFVGCEPPPDPVPPPELRLISSGIWTSVGPGERVDLGPVSLGCSTRSRVPIQNVGLSAARFQVSISSSEIEVLSAPSTLNAGEQGELELMIKAFEPESSFIRAPLIIDIEGQPSIEFELEALVVNGEWDVPRWIDFGGVEVGDTRITSDTKLTEIGRDFSREPLGFSPRSLGPQRFDTQYADLLRCPFISHVTLLGDGVESVLTGPTDLDFGDVAVGSSAERDVVVTNYSRDFLTTQVNAPFTVVSDGWPNGATRGPYLVLVPATPTVRVRFAPNAMGSVSQDLTVSAGTKTLTIPVRGNGVP
jgi:hypothetical protein